MLKKEYAIYSISSLIAVLFTWMIHEFSHWITGKSLGYDVGMTLNTVYLKSGAYKTQLHATLISASGPLITVLQAIVVFFYFNKKGWKKHWYPFLFTAFYTRLMAAIISYFNSNDEARISEVMGIGKYTLPLIVTGFLFYLIYITSKKYRLKWQFQLYTIVLIIFFSSLLILSDQFITIKLL